MHLVWRKRAQDDKKRIARYIIEEGGGMQAAKTQISVLRVLHARQQWPPANENTPFSP